MIRKHQAKALDYTENLWAEIGLDMLQIPDGNFLMGAPEEEFDRLDYEQSQHQVNVSSFFMGRYPITQAHFGSRLTARELKKCKRLSRKVKFTFKRFYLSKYLT